MRKYELMYIVRSTVEAEALEALTGKFQNVITSGGTIEKHDVLGKRRLAYEINKQRDGIYVLVNFTAGKEVVAELDRVIRISDEVIRHMITQDVA